MAEYIEKEKAVQILREEAAAHYPTPYHVGLLAAARAIESIPAADVRPVVRAVWIFEKGDGKACVDGWVCSACNCGFHTNVPYFEDFNFCPNCGADMREES